MTLITNGPWRIRPAAVSENSAVISYRIDNESEVIASETHADLVLLRDALTEYLEIVAAEHQACPNCAPGYDCERGIYTPGGAQ